MHARHPVTVREALTPSDREALLALPSRLRRADPAWVPPLLPLERRRLAASNPFFRDAELKLFLAERGGELVGTISALRDAAHERHSGEKVAWFGYFESIDDRDVARALVARALVEARRWGAERLRGPRDLTRFEKVGITIEGHDRTPPLLQGTHPRFYSGLLDAAGFTKHHDALAYETALVDELGRPRELPRALSEQAARCRVIGLRVRSARRYRLGRDLLAAHQVLNEAHRTVPDVTPISRDTFLGLGRLYLGFMSTELLQLAHVEQRPVGYAVCMPELNEAVRAARGRLLPFGWLRAAVALRRVETASFKLMGVIPEYRGRGVHAVLIANALRAAQRAGYHRLEASIIDERNTAMRAILERLGCTVYRRWRVFERMV